MLDKEASQRPAAESLSENLDAIRAGKKVELNTAGAAPRPKGTDATTTVERASLNQSVRAAYQPDAGKAVTGRQDASASVSGATNKRRNWTAFGAIVAVAAVGIFFVGLNSWGSGAVSISKAVSETNPAIGNYVLRLSSGSMEPVSLDLAEDDTLHEAFSWKSDEPIRLSYTPPFSEDEAYEGTVLPRDLGLGGFTGGRKLFLHVSLEEASTLLSFRTDADKKDNETYAIRLARGDESQALVSCRIEQEGVIGLEAASYNELYDAYLASVDRARLEDIHVGVFPIGLYWARISNLIAYMESDFQSAAAQTQLSTVSQNYVREIISAHSELISTWRDIQSKSDLQSDSNDMWDVHVSNAASGLSDKVREGRIAAFAYDTCNRLVR